MALSANDITVLRELGKTYMEIASLPVQKEKMELWKAFNSNRSTRPMVVIDQLPWNELNYDGSLTCLVENPFFRSIESNLRKSIYKWRNFPVDMVVEPFITIPNVAKSSGFGFELKETTLATDMDNDIVSHSFENQLQTEEDVEKIKDIVITYDKQKSDFWLAEAKQVFEGIIPVIQRGGVSIRLQLWDIIAELMGVEDIYFDLIDRPEFIHSIMEKMTNSALAGIKQINELNLVNDLQNTCHCSYIYTDSLLPNFTSGKGSSTKNTWGFSMAQLFTSASPETTKEFEIAYMSKIAEHYGMFYYGCCERLDDRLDIIQTIPNVKKISCSPWSNRDNFAEKLNKNIIMSNKPTPSYLAQSQVDFDIVKKDIQYTCEVARKNNIAVELILKDISTVKHDPKRLTKWAEVAMQVVEGF